MGLIKENSVGRPRVEVIYKDIELNGNKIEDKLFEAKEKLKEYYTLFPYLNPENQDRKKEIDNLQKEYEDIIALL